MRPAILWAVGSLFVMTLLLGFVVQLGPVELTMLVIASIIIGGFNYQKREDAYKA